MTIRLLRPFLLACFALGCASFAQAGILAVTPIFAPSNQSLTAGDYEGIFYDFSTTFPPDPISIGTFDFTIPTGNVISGATISGTFGDVNYSSTALVDLYVDGVTIKVGACDLLDSGTVYPPCATGTVNGSLVSWSYTFTAANLPSLASGSLDFNAVQNSFGSVIVGTPVLDLTIVPEPDSIFLLAGALLAVAVLHRRSNRKPRT